MAAVWAKQVLAQGQILNPDPRFAGGLCKWTCCSGERARDSKPEAAFPEVELFNLAAGLPVPTSLPVLMHAYSWQAFAPGSLWVMWGPTCAFKPVRHLAPAVGDSVRTQAVRDCSASASQ